MRRTVACIGIVVVCLVCAACGSAGRPERIASVNTGLAHLIGGKFSGYLWDGTVTAVHGDWNVPEISADSRDGHASTWIGAEAPGGKDAPFIQIGITEDRPLDGEPNAGTNRYAAFWSDVPHGFHPIELFTVSPGDHVTAAMTLDGGEWRLSITDTSNGRTKSFDTTEEANDQFNLAEWLQEDVTNARTNRAFPYPDIASTAFSGMTVNGTTPANDDLTSQWISTAGRYYGTSPVDNGSFTVRLVTPGSVAGRYLDIATHEDLVATALSDDLETDSGVSEGLLAAQAQALATAMIQTADGFAKQRWPADVSQLIVTLEHETRYVARKLNALHDPSAATIAQLLATVTPYGREQTTAKEIHQLLGIPYPG